MNTERWKKIDQLLDAALDLPEAQRESFLAKECGDDETLRQEVMELVNATTTAGFLERSAIGVAARKLASDDAYFSERTFLDQQIGPYKITKQIGAGGMGEVYLATDSKFFRNVALKILPPEYSADDERLQRFELEAHAISCINHPNIVTIYDVGSARGVNYLATEYVDGKNLREVGGTIKLTEILSVGIQVCEALSSAHRAGIVHRDIKPENIMLRPDGYVKVLDFGLAKLSNPLSGSISDLAKTGEGVIIGTPAYMSPEQIASEKVDYRTDLWSLGVVLYELVTGVNPFKESGRQNTFQAILHLDPPSAASANQNVSVDLDRILARALERNRSLRYQTALDLGADLKRVKREYEIPKVHGRTTQKTTPVVSPRRRLLPAVGIVAIAVLLTLAVWILVRSAQDSPAIEWNKARSVQLTDGAGTEYFPTLSPEGRSFVYSSDQAGNLDIFSKRIGGTVPTNLTANSTADDTQPAFSSDGSLIAFRSERQPQGIYVMEATGENPRRISDFGFHPAFSPDNKEIVISGSGDDQPTVRRAGPKGLWIVNIATGSKRELTNSYGSFPSWSPNGKYIAFWYYPSVGGRRDIAVIPSGGGKETSLTNEFAVSNWNPVWSPDGKFLYFVSDRNGSVNFWRIPMDGENGSATGEPEPVVAPSSYPRHLNFSRDGTRMIYVQTNNQANIQGIEFDGRSQRIVGEPFWITTGDREVTRAEVSPDGKQFLMRQIRRTQDDIVVFSRDANLWQDVTRDVSFDRYPRWSPDGTQIAFVSDRTGNYEIWTSAPDGSKLKQITFVGPSDTGTSFPTWSPDGQRMIYSANNRSFILDLNKSWAEQTPVPLPDPPDGNTFVVWDWSQDGDKVAGTFSAGTRGIGFYSFSTNAFSKLAEIPETDPLSIPSWLPDSRHIVFTKSNKILVVDVETGKTREIFAPKGGEVRSPFVSRDGRLLYYSLHINESDIWLLDNSRQE